MIFIDNKYHRWYYNIVTCAQSRNLPKTIYTEKHHIIPRCLGGSDDKSNLVKLTAREHFVCHLLLTKMVDGHEKYKLAFAARMMLRAHTPSSRIYSYIKEAAIYASKEIWNDPDFRKRETENRRARTKEQSVRSDMAERMKKVWARPEYIKKHREAMAIVRSDSQWLERNSKSQKAAWQDPVKREARLKNRKPPTAEATASRSKHTTEHNKNRWSDPEYKARVSKAIREAKAKKKAAKEAALLAGSGS
jgi:hypothetical protein